MNSTNKNPRYVRLIIPFCLALGVLSFTLSPFDKSGGENDSQSYIYDSAGRLTQVNYGDGTILKYSYDPNGNILNVESSKQEKIFFDSFETALAYLNPWRWGK